MEICIISPADINMWYYHNHICWGIKDGEDDILAFIFCFADILPLLEALYEMNYQTDFQIAWHCEKKPAGVISATEFSLL